MKRTKAENRIRKIKLKDGNVLYVFPNDAAAKRFAREKMLPAPKPMTIQEWCKTQLGLPWTDKEKP
jgi:hypothetical protein